MTRADVPADVDWDPEPLADLLGWCAEHATQQLVVAQDGRIIAEQYGNGADADSTIDVGSIQKSITWLVVGILVARGEVDLDTPMSKWLGSGWTSAPPDEESAIRLRHVLSMASGLDDDFRVEGPPGTIWYYNNNAYHQARKALEIATGATTQKLGTELVFGPIGMTHSVWAPRPGTTDESGWPIAALHTTARDMAAFGTAVLAAARGERDLGCDPDFLAASWSASQDSNPSYGLLWWLFSGERAIVPGVRHGETPDPGKSFGGITLPRPLSTSAPSDTVMGLGAGDQRVHMVPSRRLVVVRHGGPVRDRTGAGGTFDEKLWSRLAPALPPPPEGA